MGKKSVRENKNIYHICRENSGLSRDAAADALKFISADRIDRIEHDKTTPYPEEIVAMADCYKSPMLCNYYCSHECKIGQEYVPEVKVKSLSQITLEMLSIINALTKEKERLIDITVDGTISDDEVADFKRIQGDLDKMSLTIESLKLWVSNMAASGKLGEGEL